ncbi:carbohydrate ABC transporter permease [Amycolatopsis cihanbeyliensis]|uniref:Cellobiose transport system permease protein n=1 Tax=Amycolatopsis cihanbeyliensis TaxID=1128664 RepID=A0A542DQ36_AMYCI|nr:sugar ABC transporter permease [Amycolatopsis cihanbeyliensis]TQJ05218.1 cellobiose transport system permease protein [Amycolatopsis cihanbeyliensis]
MTDLRPGTAERTGKNSRATPPPRRRLGSFLGRVDTKWSPYLFVAPFFVIFGIFGLFPLVYTAWVSLHQWSMGGSGTFIGFENYVELFDDPDFWNATINTLGMLVLATVPQLLIALVLASLLNQGLRKLTFLRVGVLLPIVTSVAAIGIVFSQIYDRDAGMVNGMLGLIGVDAVDWRADKWSSWIAISTMVNWRWTGYNALIYLAAMQSVPRDLYEAAIVDGASRIRQFWNITVPMIRPAIIFTVIISTIAGMQLFTEPLIFGQGSYAISGGSLRQFQTLSMYMFEKAFRDFDYGYGSAVAWMIFVLIMLLALINFLIMRKGK